MRNLPEWIVSFAAILSVGAVSVSLNAWWTEEELDYAIGDAGLSVLMCDPERMAKPTAGLRGARRPDHRDAYRHARARPPGRAPLRDVVVRGNPMPDVDVPRGRRDDPVHLGDDGVPQGGGLDPPLDLPGADGLRCNGAMQA
jgi:long-chain acyl-CoA synthetase